MLLASSLLFYSHHSKNNLPLSYLADVSTLIIILAKSILSYHKIPLVCYKFSGSPRAV